MLSATTTSENTSANELPEQSHTHSELLPSTNHVCTSCRITFQNVHEQRKHMKEPWHVYNLKQRIASLPPISHDDFDIKIIEKAVVKDKPISGYRKRVGDEETISGDVLDQHAWLFQCLFCSQDYPRDDVGFVLSLEHMRVAHGMSIPNMEMVIDLQSFVSYLATEIRVWHECLYCGATKTSVSSIQSHMKDKGHCRLNLDREPELLDFWESSEIINDGDTAALEQQCPIDLSAMEIRFASGRVIGPRNAISSFQKVSKKRSLESTAARISHPTSENTDPPPSMTTAQIASGRQLARRDEMSLLGVSAQQRRALLLVEKKAQRSEAMARRAREWLYAEGANLQKYDQVDGKMKMGKQNHKLQPR